MELCSVMNATCIFKEVPTLGDRFTVLNETSNPADFSIGSITVTDDRKEIVSFVQPYYYSTGTTLFSLPGKFDASKLTWDSIKGKKVCVKEGNVALKIAALNSLEISLFQDNTTAEEIQGRVRDGTCIGTLTDSSYAQDLGLNQTGLEPLDPSPYGIAVEKGNEAMRHSLDAAMVALMDQGNASVILQLQQQYMIDNGMPPNKDLENVVDLISTFQAPENGSSGSGSAADGPSPLPSASYARTKGLHPLVGMMLWAAIYVIRG